MIAFEMLAMGELKSGGRKIWEKDIASHFKVDGREMDLAGIGERCGIKLTPPNDENGAIGLLCVLQGGLNTVKNAASGLGVLRLSRHDLG